MIDTFFFDWDGTLNESAAQSFEALRKTFEALGVSLEPDAYEKAYRPNWYAMFEELGLPQERWDEADLLWMRHYDYDASRLTPGAREVVDRIAKRGFAAGVVTSGSRVRILREMGAFGLTDMFRVVVCGEDVANRKPHPEALELAMRRVERGAESCCYIGDCPEDIEMGRRAGVRTVGVRSDFPTSRRLRDARPDLYFDSLSQFTAMLK